MRLISDSLLLPRVRQGDLGGWAGRLGWVLCEFRAAARLPTLVLHGAAVVLAATGSPASLVLFFNTGSGIAGAASNSALVEDDLKHRILLPSPPEC